MTTRDDWQKSSYSGSGDGNACVEIANRHTHIAIRDTKAPAGATLSFPADTFTAFIYAMKAHSTGMDFTSFRS